MICHQIYADTFSVLSAELGSWFRVFLRFHARHSFIAENFKKLANHCRGQEIKPRNSETFVEDCYKYPNKKTMMQCGPSTVWAQRVLYRTTEIKHHRFLFDGTCSILDWELNFLFYILDTGRSAQTVWNFLLGCLAVKSKTHRNPEIVLWKKQKSVSW